MTAANRIQTHSNCVCSRTQTETKNVAITKANTPSSPDVIHATHILNNVVLNSGCPSNTEPRRLWPKTEGWAIAIVVVVVVVDDGTFDGAAGCSQCLRIAKCVAGQIVWHTTERLCSICIYYPIDIVRRNIAAACRVPLVPIWSPKRTQTTSVVGVRPQCALTHSADVCLQISSISTCMRRRSACVCVWVLYT